MVQANTSNVSEYFENKVKKLGNKKLAYVDKSSSSVDIVFTGKLTQDQKKKISKDVLNILDDNFSGTFSLGKFTHSSEFGDETSLSVLVDQGGVAGPTPTAVQEKGTTFVLNQVLKNNKKFDSGSDILSDKDTYDGLVKIFGTYKDNIKEWAHTYYEQQKVFLIKFRGKRWQPFEYGKKDFVHFFQDQMDKIVETPEPIKPAGDYTTWNPSDIWAVYDKDKVTKEIDAALDPSTQSLTELNALLLKLFKQKRLVGVSLKKIGNNKLSSLKLVNINTASMKLGEVETYKMSDIKFKLENIMTDKMTVYIQYKGGNFGINVLKSGNSSTIGNLGFNTQIKSSAAQGGQVPVAMLQEQLKKRTTGKVTFVNDHNKYPKNIEEFKERSDEFKKYFDSVKKNGKMSSSATYDKFKSMIVKFYQKGTPGVALAKTKLMQLNFFHDAFISHSTNSKKSVEFWTDLLHFGMKMNVRSGGRFAPHIKIS